MAEASERSSRLFTDGQRRIVGFALTLLALIGSVALLIFAFNKIGQLLGHFSGVLWPLAVAGIVALILRPLVDTLQHRLKLKRTGAVILLYGMIVLALGAALLLIIPPIVEQALDFINFAPTLWKRAVAYVQQHYPEWIAIWQRQLENPTIRKAVDGLMAEFRGMISLALPSLKAAGGSLLSVFGFFANLAIIPIYLFFFLLSRREPTNKLGKQLTFLPEPYRDDVVFLIREFISIVISFFRGQLLIALVMGVLLAAGFSIVGLKFGLVIGLFLGVLNIIPYLGTIVGLSIALPLAFFQPEGGWSLVAWVLGVFIVVQNIEGWFLTPKIMADRTGLHPVIVIIAIFFWGTALNGILGMILAIPLTAFFVTAWRLARHKYFDNSEPARP